MRIPERSSSAPALSRGDLVAGAVSFQHEEDIDVLLADELDELVDVPLAPAYKSAPMFHSMTRSRITGT